MNPEPAITAPPVPTKPKRTVTRIKIRFPIGSRDHVADFVTPLGVQVVRRGKNWRVEATLQPTYNHHMPPVVIWKGGKARTNGRAVNTAHVHSSARILSFRRLHYRLHTTERVIELPEGYGWLRLPPSCSSEGCLLALVQASPDSMPIAPHYPSPQQLFTLTGEQLVQAIIDDHVSRLHSTLNTVLKV
jgi:hypothetical protein